MTPSPPAELVRALKAYDPTLSLRWGVRCERWIVVKKVDDRVGRLLKERPNPYKSLKGHDRYDVWRDGYDDVLFIDPSLIQLTGLVMDRIAEADLQRAGGREALNRRLDELDEQKEREANRAIAHFTEAAASEAYDRLQWGLGNRVAITTPDPLAKAQRHEDGFVIVDRRVLA